jgi:hypothetical protein
MLPSLISGWVLCFVIISGILSAPLVLSAPGSYYLSVEIYSRYVEGQAPTAAAASLCLAGRPRQSSPRHNRQRLGRSFPHHAPEAGKISLFPAEDLEAGAATMTPNILYLQRFMETCRIWHMRCHNQTPTSNHSMAITK